MNKIKKMVGVFLLFSYALSFYGQTIWHNPMDCDSVPALCGRAFNTEIGKNYHRLPKRFSSQVRADVWNLSCQSAGLSLRFYTNATQISVKYKVKGGYSMPHMPATGVSGVDLYTIDCNGKTAWCEGKWSFGDTIRYEFKELSYHNLHNKGNEFRLYLPLYNEVTSMYIGIPAGNEFHFISETGERPVVVYGTSIAQGACASRPGMAWTNYMQRITDTPVVNLGFSGNGQLEEPLFKALSEISAQLYIIDCMPNMTGERTALIQERIKAGVKMLREHNNTPILLIEHDGYMGGEASNARKKEYEKTNQELRSVYEQLCNDGITNLHYLTQKELGLNSDSQVDGVHASDWGMAMYAKSIGKKVNHILGNISIAPPYTACKQRREPDNYEWNERHEQIMTYTQAQQPEIVMIGNSITHFWGGEPIYPNARASKCWEKLFKGKKVVNMGFGWDRIENMIWRIQHGELDGFKAKKIFVMAGTNNLERDSNEEIIKGLEKLVAAIRKRQPQATLYIQKIYPRRGLEERIKRLNQELENKLKSNASIQWVDVWDELILRNGKINESLFSDGLHPNAEGYNRIASVLKHYLK